MGNQRQRSRELAQEPLQPFDGRNVEVVGRFVQKQDVRVRHEHADKLRSHLPAAAELLERSIQVLARKAQAEESRLGAVAKRVSVPVFELRLQLSQLLQRCALHSRIGNTVRKFMFQLVDPFLDCREFRHPAFGIFQQGIGTGTEIDLLTEMSKPTSARQRERPAVGRTIAHQEAEHRALPRPVRPDNPHPLPGPDPKTHLPQNLLLAVSLADIDDINHRPRTLPNPRPVSRRLVPLLQYTHEIPSGNSAAVPAIDIDVDPYSSSSRL